MNGAPPADRQTRREPEDILSSADMPPATFTEGSGRRIAVPEENDFERVDSSKVLMLMLASIIIIVLGAVGWFFWPRISNRFFSSADTAVAPQDTAQTVPNAVPDTSPSAVVHADSKLDSDRDGLPDTQEIGLGLDPQNTDTDGDTLSDRDEVEIYNTDPNNPDTDGDSFLDGNEVRGGYDPNGPGRLDDISRIIPIP